MSPANKIVLLAMDAGDKNLIQEWATDGILPTMRSLLSRGLVGETVSVEGLYEGSTWPSFYTGVNPARHGFHRLVQIEPGTYEFHRRYPGEFIKREPFWNRLSRAGRRVAILDVPLTGISEGLGGIQTVEWGSHDAVYGFQAWPRESQPEITRRFGNHPVGSCCDSVGTSAKDLRRFRDQLIEGVMKKTELTLRYLGKLSGTSLPKCSPRAIASVISAGISTTRLTQTTIGIWSPLQGIRSERSTGLSIVPSGRYWRASMRKRSLSFLRVMGWRTMLAWTSCLRRY